MERPVSCGYLCYELPVSATLFCEKCCHHIQLTHTIFLNSIIRYLPHQLFSVFRFLFFLFSLFSRSLIFQNLLTLCQQLHCIFLMEAHFRTAEFLYAVVNHYFHCHPVKGKYFNSITNKTFLTFPILLT